MEALEGTIVFGTGGRQPYLGCTLDLAFKYARDQSLQYVHLSEDRTSCASGGQPSFVTCRRAQGSIEA